MIVTSEYNAVDSSKVSAASKPTEPSFWSLALVVEGRDVQLRFGSQDERDGFYKELVDQMGK